MFMQQEFIDFFDTNYKIDLDGCIHLKSSNRKTDSLKVFQDYASACTKLGKLSQVSKDDIDKYVEEETRLLKEAKAAANANDDIPQNSYEFTIRFIEQVKGKGWRFDPSMRMIERVHNGVPVNSDLNELANAVFVRAIKEGLQKKFKQGEIKAALAEIASRASLTVVTKIAASIAYDASCMDKAELFLRTLYDEWRIKQPYEVFKGVMMHVLWQCKRKLLGRSVQWDLILNFYGGTGIGKTTMVQYIGSVFGDFAIVSTLSEILDPERQVKKLSECYYANLDELTVGNAVDNKFGNDNGSLTRAQKVAFKKIVTQRKARTRIMGGQSQSSQRYTVSFVASSNTHLADVVYDPTTMRRYVEIECERICIEDFSKLDAIKPLLFDLWKSVDENSDTGYWYPGSAIWKAVSDLQKTYYPTNTTTEAWLRNSDLVPCLVPARLPEMTLYREYKHFCEEHNNIPKNYDNWKTDIEHLKPAAVAPDGTVSMRKVAVTNVPMGNVDDL